MMDTYVKQFTPRGETYDAKCSTLTVKTTIAAFMARAKWISDTVKINGQTMTLTATTTNEYPNNSQIMTLTRLD